MSRTHKKNDKDYSQYPKGKNLKDYSLHHKIGQCNRERANINEPDNKVIVENTKHLALNTLMGHNQEPQKQLEVMYNEWWKGVISSKAEELIKLLIDMPRDKFYANFMLKK